MKKQQKNSKSIILLSLIFITLSVVFLVFYKEIWWDSAVYSNIGKFIFSNGNFGIWEDARPLVLPLILGLGWKIGFNEVMFVKIVSLAFSLGSILMVYLISKKYFSQKTAIYSSIFTAFSSIFFFFSSLGMTEIPSVFFALLSLYFLFENRPFVSGLFSGIAFMARFFSIFAIIPIYLFHLIYFDRKKFVGKYSKVFFGFVAVIVPYLILNVALYHNVLYPFQLQINITKITGWQNYHSFWFYFIELIKQNPFL